MGFTDPNSVHNPATGSAPPAAWGDQVRDDLMACHGPPRVRVYKTLTQGIGAGNVNVNFEAAFMDSHGMWDIGNPDRLTVPADWPEHWLIGASVLWQQSASGTFRNLEIWLNDSIRIANDVVPIAASGYCAQTVVMPFGGVPGDYYTVQVSQDTGGSLNVEPDGYSGTVFWATFLGNGAG